MKILDQISQNDSPAIIFKDIAINYSELQNRILKTSHYLLENDINADDRIIILLNNSVEFIILVFSLWNIGAIPV
ncbi:MAG: hypothetical protein COW08_05390, partial [Ignavibacteriales bacterium CG12_big_fil_rev_8_21_14_0_65_30_8]